MVKDIYHTNRMLFFVLILEGVCAAAQNVVGIYLPKAAVELAAAPMEWARLLPILAALTLGLVLLNAAHGWASAEEDSAYYDLRMSYMRRIVNKSMNQRYGRLESDEGQNNYWKARGAVLDGNLAQICWDMVQLMTTFLSFASFGWIIGSLHPLIVVFLIAASAVTFFMMKRGSKIWDSYRDERARVQKQVWVLTEKSAESRHGKDIRLYNAQPMIEKAIAADKDEREGRRRYKRSDRRTGAFGSGFSGFLQGTSYAYVILRAVSGALSAGQVVKFASSIYSFWSSFSAFVSQWAMLKADCERMEDTLSFMALDNGKVGGSRPVPETRDLTFEFRNISFTYPGGASPALSHINCTLKQGERVAVVGLNGSGKTTFIKLLCRLYHPSEGEILLNGVNIEEFELNGYMRLLSMVFQDFVLFPFTLGENVAAAEGYDGERAAAVLETAGFGDRLKTLEKGLGTVLYKDCEDDGLDVSGGEAQKIALARALYKDSPFMVLDEPTAALDPVAEYDIYTRFNGFTNGKGAVYISHRLSSCVFCDRIMVFEDGKIVQTGGHRDLVSADGLYSRLWNAQAQYYKN